jgi:hypothetical protein
MAIPSRPCGGWVAVETVMADWIKRGRSIHVLSSSSIVAWLDGNWQHCVDSFDAVPLDYNGH